MSVFDLFYISVFIVLSPLILLKSLLSSEFRKNFLARLTPLAAPTVNSNQSDSGRIWIHAASVGEVNLALTLIQAFNKFDTSSQFVLTTNTLSGFQIARENSSIPVYIAPLDFSFLLKKFIKVTQVTDLLLIETEIWPNMISLISKTGKIAIANGRLSDRHFNRYLKGRYFLKKTMSRISLVLVGDQTSAKRFIKLGISSRNVSSLGNLKFEVPSYPPADQIAALKQQFFIEDQQFIFVAGSIQPEEMIPLLKAWKILKNKIGSLRFFLIPRHPEKREEFIKSLQDFSVSAFFSSQESYRAEYLLENRIHIIDQIGVLKAWYALSKAVFVGGSLCSRGGQNMLEAIGMKKPVCIGPYATNFKQEVDMLQAVEGIRIVEDENELTQFILECYENNKKGKLMGERGYQVLKRQATVLEKNVERLYSFFH